MNAGGQTAAGAVGNSHRKSVFRPVYLLLTLYTLWNVGAALVADTMALKGDSPILAAFNGVENQETLRVTLIASHLATVGFVMLAYLQLEGLEEGTHPFSGSPLAIFPSVWQRVTEYGARLFVALFIVFLPKLAYINNYAGAWMMICGLTFLVCLWLAVLYLTGERFSPMEWVPIFATAVVSGLLTLAARYELETTLGLLIALITWVLGLSLLAWIWSTLLGLVRHLWKGACDWMTTW